MLLLGDKEGPDDGDQDYREDDDEEEELGAREPVPKQQETNPQGRWAGTSIHTCPILHATVTCSKCCSMLRSLYMYSVMHWYYWDLWCRIIYLQCACTYYLMELWLL